MELDRRRHCLCLDLAQGSELSDLFTRYFASSVPLRAFACRSLDNPFRSTPNCCASSGCSACYGCCGWHLGLKAVGMKIRVQVRRIQQFDHLPLGTDPKGASLKVRFMMTTAIRGSFGILAWTSLVPSSTWALRSWCSRASSTSISRPADSKMSSRGAPGRQCST